MSLVAVDRGKMDVVLHSCLGPFVYLLFWTLHNYMLAGSAVCSVNERPWIHDVYLIFFLLFTEQSLLIYIRIIYLQSNYRICKLNACNFVCCDRMEVNHCMHKSIWKKREIVKRMLLVLPIILHLEVRS